MHTRSICWLSVPVLAVASISVQATQYATPDEAAKRSFPAATSFKESLAQLNAQEIRAIGDAAGLPVRKATWRIITALNGDKPIGVVVIDSVIGKFELIDYAVALGADGKIVNVEILNYRESHGYEVRLPAWRKQFVGKGPEAKLHVNEDIANISGATMSSTNVTDGVRGVVALVASLKAAGRM
jgi:Na+-translocating ferredoxin:NAD+ oxidoreductase RnfG subunit